MSESEPMSEMLELVAVHGAGGLTADQQQRLHELLAGSAELRRVFVQEQLMDAAFHLETPGSAEMETPLAVLPRRRWAGVRRGRWVAAAAVIFLLGLALGGMIPFPKVPALVVEDTETMDDGIALVTREVDAEWEGENTPVAGSILSEGMLRLARGLAQIEFYSGARLILEGPVDLELVSANEAICHAGRLRAFVPPQARGFKLTSPQFQLIDLGTEFGMEVGSESGSRIQVFDGEVELYPKGVERSSVKGQRLLGGGGLSWLNSGEKTKFPSNPESFPSFDDVRTRSESRSMERWTSWQAWNAELADDPRIAVRYDFERRGRVLWDSTADRAHGTIVGCEWTNGRWAEKKALEFKRPSDRVRVDIPGSFDALTLTAWIRVDAITNRAQALLLTDGYEVGRPHWQISPQGALRLGIRLPAQTERIVSSGYGSPVLFTPRQIGVWSLVATVYDRAEGVVRHFVDGREVAKEALQQDRSLQIGAAEIGNWGAPLGGRNQPIRNFIGRMDEMTLWRVALSAEEMQAIYQRTRP